MPDFGSTRPGAAATQGVFACVVTTDVVVAGPVGTLVGATYAHPAALAAPSARSPRMVAILIFATYKLI
jgi:hypothetical protein